MKVVVLGGNGFLGAHVCQSLWNAGHTVRVFDRGGTTPCVIQQEGLEFFEGDFSNIEAVERALSGCEAAYHLISTTLPKTSNEDPVYDLETNLLGTVKLLAAAQRQGVGKVLFASSGGTIYGIPQETPITESHPTDPICAYGIGKLAIEKYLQLFEYLYAQSFCVLRIANPYGEGQLPTRAQGAISVFAYKALQGESIDIWGDGSVVRDYIHVQDVASAFLKALTYTGSHRIFNIGSGTGHSVNEILATLEGLSEHGIRRNYMAARSFDVPVNVLNTGRAREQLGWEPRISLTDGLARTFAWLKQL